MIVKKIYVQDYSSGKEYRYTDQSGSANSIEAVGGEIGAGPQSGAGNAATATGSPSAYNAPSNSGRLPSSTSKSEATSGASGNNADSSGPPTTRPRPRRPRPPQLELTVPLISQLAAAAADLAKPIPVLLLRLWLLKQPGWPSLRQGLIVEWIL